MNAVNPQLEWLTDIAARAYEANLGGDDPMKDAVAAVVRALEPGIDKMIFKVQEGALEKPAILIAKEFVEAIVGGRK